MSDRAGRIATVVYIHKALCVYVCYLITRERVGRLPPSFQDSIAPGCPRGYFRPPKKFRGRRLENSLFVSCYTGVLGSHGQISVKRPRIGKQGQTKNLEVKGGLKRPNWSFLAVQMAK